ncbi:glutamyl-tRNA synthetase [Desulfacinum hydrothermale DSM 13146]|uniref:Glutamate--tRNA ligase n=1 Tax=Desulfacinum hydrothermale DSM 13146 TaxID=1121390 RepID=A0A1W1X6P4_9BACT|nr:glutamate--tRNA ligase [Desulfacinum hydrothermale]SMC19602.1 glutamyl-tRNA synthetase [Desulfacinum hydrothermale DSM 13146]
MEQVITRFAPSPTGYLHIGGARTALFNWLFARHHGGKFILRIEDTDRERSTEESIRAILDAMQWLGMDWDEGPYYQTQRLDVYRDYLQRLLDKGLAYYCDCSPEDVERRRQEALKAGKKPKYDGRCRDKGLGPGPGRVVRFRCPQVGTTVLNDLIKGAIEFENSELDDLVLQRSDGYPTYNFAVVVDDVSMKVNYVIRGDDHVNNTPRQILLYQALEAPLPRFAHVPMILGPDRTRLSKRHGATSVMAYKDQGYLPEALVNYLARLGWSYGDQEIFSRQELIEKFDLDRVGASAGVFDQEKLLWLNAHYIKEKPAGEIAGLLKPFLAQRNYPEHDDAYLERAVTTLQPRCRTLQEMADAIAFYLVEEVDYDPKAATKFLKPELAAPLRSLIETLRGMEPFQEEELEKAFRRMAEEMGVKLGKIAQPVRVALTGVTASPGLFEIIDILGKETVLRRLEKALEFVEARAQ